ncbi:MAG: aminopeptidase [Ruminiclostridium sp.]|nr:aminopeptidase [Ruminiclostridium sp.]
MAKETKKTGKSKAEELKEKLFYTKKHTTLIMSDAEQKKADKYCEGYKKFLDSGKTEREACATAVEMAEKAGFKLFDKNAEYKAGDKVYTVNRGKAVIFAVIGKQGIENGVNLTAAHIDSPRIDLKQNPLYEADELGYFKTHYYGGIKKYQWTAIPLSLHGVIAKNDGTVITVNIGEDEADPCFVVTDLLPHLAEEQYKRPANKLITGEELNILIGSRPFKDDETSDAVKLNLMNILFEKYGIVEKDFLSAELECVPAMKARDVGFDRSLVGAYGQDDRVCSYTAFTALLDMKGIPQRTAVCVLTDKEETGSDGNTGLCSSYLKFFLYDLAENGGSDGRTVMTASRCLSADVNAGFDPTFPEGYERKNSAFMNKGIVVTKYTGARGKSGTSDANAEYVGFIHSMLDKNEVVWQTGELGKVDFGGGGTVAAYIANLNIDTIDVGVPVLSMHAPFEITAKNDVYMAYKAFSAFYKAE